MRTDDFWAMVQRTRQERHGESVALAALTGELQRLGEDSIRSFEQHLHEQLAALDTLVLRDVATQLWVLSDDAWLHFRAWCISQGRTFVATITAEPGRVLREVAATRSGPFDPPNGELFLYCADYARVARSKAVA